MELRPYQQDAVAALSADIKRGLRRVCVSLPTGSGKSLVIAALCRRALAKGSRVLILAHQSELLIQNEAELLNLFPEAKTGIYCAKLNRRQFDTPIVFASRDSLGRKPLQGGHFDLILIDEAHLVNFAELKKDSTGNYAKILNAQDENVIIIGLTATPYRKKEFIYNKGKIKDKFFENLSYKITMEELTAQGFLVPYTFPSDDLQVIDADNVKVDSTGDYNILELESISITQEAVDKCIEQWSTYGYDRNLSLFFCCSRNHASVVLQSLQSMNVHAGYIDGETPSAERAQIIEDSKNGKYRALVNVNVLTTGINIRNIDCIVLLRATKSVSLWVQMLGRGARLHDTKSDFLVLDMAGNFDRFNSPDNPNLRGNFKTERKQFEKETGQAMSKECPKKVCPNCEEECHVATTKCLDCGHIFFNHFAGKSYVHMALTTTWKKIMSIKFLNHTTSKGQKDWIRVEFIVFEKGVNQKYYLFVPPYPSDARTMYLKLLAISPKNISIWGYKIPIEIEVEMGMGAKQFIKDWRPLQQAFASAG